MMLSQYCLLMASIFGARLFGPFGSTAVTLMWLVLYVCALWNDQ